MSISNDSPLPAGINGGAIDPCTHPRIAGHPCCYCNPGYYGISTPEPAGEPLAEVVLPELDVTEEDLRWALLHYGDESDTDRWHSSEVDAQKDRHCRERQLLSSMRTIGQLREQIDLTKQLEVSALPCGHLSRYAFTDDGGKTGYCTLCEVEQLTEQLKTAQAEIAAQKAAK